MENQEQIEYDFEAHRVFMRPDKETTTQKILRDNIMARFRYDVDREIIRLRAKAEEELNKTHTL
jgi:hypothetical protein